MMKTLNEEALQACSELHEFESKQYLKVVSHLEQLGLAQHTSAALCALAESGVSLAKM